MQNKFVLRIRLSMHVLCMGVYRVRLKAADVWWKVADVWGKAADVLDKTSSVVRIQQMVDLDEKVKWPGWKS